MEGRLTQGKSERGCERMAWKKINREVGSVKI